MDTFVLFLFVGLVAQAVDGALGMAYGVISSSVLLAFGVPPSVASATVHGAEVFTTGASAASHVVNKNVEWRLFIPLAVAGVIGGVAGTYLLSGLSGDVVKPYIVVYLLVMGLYILWRASKDAKPKKIKHSWIVAPLGLVGGFFDAIGGGGWGPTVSSAMVGVGEEPRRAIGTSNTAEFFLTTAISAAFLWALLSGHWEDADNLQQHIWAVAGLVVGGLIAAPFAGLITRKVPRNIMTWIVGGVLVVLAIFQGLQLFGIVNLEG